MSLTLTSVDKDIKATSFSHGIEVGFEGDRRWYPLGEVLAETAEAMAEMPDTPDKQAFKEYLKGMSPIKGNPYGGWDAIYIMPGTPDYWRSMVQASDGNTVKFKDMEITYGDFFVAVEYLLTNNSVISPDDARLDFLDKLGGSPEGYSRQIYERLALELQSERGLGQAS
jgi:hypothetical protein